MIKHVWLEVNGLHGMEQLEEKQHREKKKKCESVQPTLRNARGE